MHGELFRPIPWAYHVFPLHAAKTIWAGGLFSKRTLQQQGLGGMKRSTTFATDTLLGFDDFVHFYLPENQAQDCSLLPILKARGH